MEKIKNHHAPGEWHYESQGKKYIKVGTSGLDDLEYVVMSTKIIINGHKIYTTIEEAYREENRLWAKYVEEKHDVHTI